MKKIIYAFLITTITFAACSQKDTLITTKNLPKGIEINDFKEDYFPVKGIHKVSFTLVNNTGKTISIPSVSAAFYKDGILKGPATGGCLEPLTNTNACSSDVSWLLPESRADSVVFSFDGVIN